MRNYLAILLTLFLLGCGGNPDFMPTPKPQPVPNDLGGCMSANALMLGYGGGFLVDAADFDGTNDHMAHAADLTGIADGKSGILSAWMRLDGSNSVIITTFGSAGNLYFIRDSSNKIAINGYNTAVTRILGLATVNLYTASGTWLHVLSSWDLAIGASNLYINDVSDKTVIALTNDTINYIPTSSGWNVSKQETGTARLNGCLAELYFAPNQYLDFSVEANRRKFISAAGKPVHLGVDGSLPTGTAPIVYLHLDNGEAVANFSTNRGTGGNFSITGTLDTASTSPSD